MVAHTFGPAFGGRDMDLCEFEARTAYIVRSRIARATKYGPVLILNIQTNQTKKEENEKDVREKEVSKTFSHHKHLPELQTLVWRLF